MFDCAAKHNGLAVFCMVQPFFDNLLVNHLAVHNRFDFIHVKVVALARDLIQLVFDPAINHIGSWRNKKALSD